ncbi:MAG: sporulation protein YunB [Oscillospiraceae bacterium]|nr:sporulation protein YunB [Oscillospiraceae bacterium]
MAFRFRCWIIGLQGKVLPAVRLLLFFTVLVLIGRTFAARMNPIVENIVSYRLRTTAVKMINETVLDEMKNYSSEHFSFVNVGRDTQGNITDIQTNTLQLNRLQAAAAVKIADKLEQKEMNSLAVTAGSLTGVHLLAGRGPMITFCVIPFGGVETRLESRFKSVGVNQTLHRMIMTVTVEMAASNILCSIPVLVQTDVCLGETVIVGNIPQAYTNIGNSQSEDAETLKYRAGSGAYQGNMSQPLNKENGGE